MGIINVMICGVGIDVIEISRIKNELLKSGERFCKTIFTENEITYCQRGSNINVQSQCFAGRFAAKEAFFKAIGTGLRGGLTWKDIEVYNDEYGKPNFILKNKALETVEDEGISNIKLSISHCNTVAIAVVILEKHDND
jgi:holo-[acyl-carrier protein] synthase